MGSFGGMVEIVSALKNISKQVSVKVVVFTIGVVFVLIQSIKHACDCGGKFWPIGLSVGEPSVPVCIGHHLRTQNGSGICS